MMNPLSSASARRTATGTAASWRLASWLPALLVAGAFLLSGCGATAPVVQSVDGPDQLEAGESGTFEAAINDDADEPLTYQWDFGDGSSGSGLLTTHAFEEPGDYTVTFTASNEGGESSGTTQVTVVPAPQPARISTINANPNPADTGESIRFTSNVSGDSPISYAWDFGDGTTAEAASGTHTYDEPGTYTVRLRASNEVGEDTRTLTMTVERALPPICTSITEMNSAYFGVNSSTLTDEARSSLQENLDILEQCPNLDARIEGFAAPSERNAQSLSEDRARAVAQFYQDNGIDASRLTTSGEGQPSGQTSKKGGTRQFRRVDTIPQR
jgi:outer membrane protein OmpA-like peptidoglycan-associated protein